MQPGEIGKHLSAGLPNITGTMSDTACARQGLTTDGAIGGSYESAQGPWMGDTPETAYIGFSFNASWSNALYGAADTVMPASTNIPVILYLGR